MSKKVRDHTILKKDKKKFAKRSNRNNALNRSILNIHWSPWFDFLLPAGLCPSLARYVALLISKILKGFRCGFRLTDKLTRIRGRFVYLQTIYEYCVQSENINNLFITLHKVYNNNYNLIIVIQHYCITKILCEDQNGRTVKLFDSANLITTTLWLVGLHFRN